MKLKTFNFFVYLIIFFLIAYAFFDYFSFIFNEQIDHYSRISLFGITNEDENFSYNSRYLFWPNAGMYNQFARFFPTFLVEFKFFSLIFNKNFVVENINFFQAVSSTILVVLSCHFIYKNNKNFFFILIFLLSTPFVLSYNAFSNSDRYVLLFLILYLYSLEKNYLLSVIFFALTVMSKEIALASLGLINFLYISLNLFMKNKCKFNKIFFISSIITVFLSIIYIYLILQAYFSGQLQIYASANNFSFMKSLNFLFNSIFSDALLYLLLILSIISNFHKIKNFNFNNLKLISLSYGISYLFILIIIGAYSSKYFLPVYLLIINSIDFKNLSKFYLKNFYILASLLLVINLPSVFHTLIEIKFAPINSIITQNNVNKIFQSSCNMKEKTVINIFDKPELLIRDKDDYWDRTFFKRVSLQNESLNCNNVDLILIDLNTNYSLNYYKKYIYKNSQEYDNIYFILNSKQSKELLIFLKKQNFEIFNVSKTPSSFFINHNYLKHYLLYIFRYYDNYIFYNLSYDYMLKFKK
tara:strand:- start:6186 stop:7763 length:1578 start_codon:yes stop_codon:yes gene_type:complete